MKAVRPHGRAGGEHQRAENIHTPKAVPTLGLDEKHYLAWGVLRLTLGVVQIAFAATAILCLIHVGLSSDSLLHCCLLGDVLFERPFVATGTVSHL
jgi:hypothetical protein